MIWLLDDNTLSTFLEGKFHQNSQRVDKRIKIYLEDPNNEENVHDVRTSLRRLDTFYSLLPKKAAASATASRLKSTRSSLGQIARYGTLT